MRRRTALYLFAPMLLTVLLAGASPALAQGNPYPGTTTVTAAPAATVPITPATGAPSAPAAAAPAPGGAHGGLAFTGLDVAVLVAVALLLIATGASFLVWRRRQDAASPSRGARLSPG